MNQNLNEMIHGKQNSNMAVGMMMNDKRAQTQMV